MPFPSVIEFGALIHNQLVVAGAPGSVVTGPVTGTTYNALHKTVDIMLGVVVPAVQTAWLGGLFAGSVGGVSVAGGPPGPVPVITPSHFYLASQPLLPQLAPYATADAAGVGWAGPFGSAIGMGVGNGALLAMMQTSMTIQTGVGETAFTSFIGFVEFTRIEPTSDALIPSVLAAWAADPDLGPAPRASLAKVMVEAFLRPLGMLSLVCAITNSVPPAVPPPPLVPILHTVPLVIS
jgi:hypothetical protein